MRTRDQFHLRHLTVTTAQEMLLARRVHVAKRHWRLSETAKRNVGLHTEYERVYR